jgi:hydroxypyruvate isomerase
MSACLEMLFVAEASSIEERILLATAAGLPAVEFWRWTNKDIPAIKAALRDSGARLTGIVAEPMIGLTDRANQAAFVEGLKQSVEVAVELGAPVVIAQAGDDRPDVARSSQRIALVDCLSASADVLKNTGVRLALEPLNTTVDHAGYFLSSTVEGLDIVDEVGRPEVRLLYDIYHSMVMGEVPEQVLSNRVDRIAHVHVADHPGRNQPGTGRLGLADAIGWLEANGYEGWYGLEFRPIGPTSEAIAQAISLLGE